MRKLISYGIIVLFALSPFSIIRAQSLSTSGISSNFMLQNPGILNPAYIGMSRSVCGLYGLLPFYYAGSINSTGVFDYGFADSSLGVGINFNHYKIHENTGYRVGIPFGFRAAKLSKAEIRIGAEVNLQKNVYSSEYLSTMKERGVNIKYNRVNSPSLDVSIGAAFISKRLHLGIALHNLNKPYFDDLTLSMNYVGEYTLESKKQHIGFTSNIGYLWTKKENRNWQFKSDFFVNMGLNHTPNNRGAREKTMEMMNFGIQQLATYKNKYIIGLVDIKSVSFGYNIGSFNLRTNISLNSTRVYMRNPRIYLMDFMVRYSF